MASAKRKNSRKGRSLRGSRKSHRTASSPPDLMAIMVRFAQALSLVIVCHRSLAAQPSADVGDEEETLRRAIRLLRDVYNEIDVASMAMDKKSR